MKKLSLFALALLPSLAFASSTSDQLERIDRELKTCLAEEGGSSTIGMKMCLGNADAEADELLNKNYKGQVAALKKKTGDRESDADNKEILRRLVAAQRAWIPSRSADCELSSSIMLGGTGEGVEAISCHYSKTVERVKYLEDIVSVRD